ncbi:MAG: hypothetical protein EXR76_12250 [Myxococcales bacterium]|nr:hypothetical protein [Myxococcales bacterium]
MQKFEPQLLALEYTPTAMPWAWVGRLVARPEFLNLTFNVYWAGEGVSFAIGVNVADCRGGSKESTAGMDGETKKLGAPSSWSLRLYCTLDVKPLSMVNDPTFFARAITQILEDPAGKTTSVKWAMGWVRALSF